MADGLPAVAGTTVSAALPPPVGAAAEGASRGRDDLAQRRARRVLSLGSAVLTASGLFWGVYFLLRGDWLSVGLDFAGAASGVIVHALTRAGHERAASRLLMGAAMVFVCANALLDVPSAEIPRSVHVYLLAVAVGSSLLTRGESAALRHAVPALCVLAYVVFGSTNIGWSSAYSFPESVREHAVWINHGIAMLTVYAIVQVILNDAAERSATETALRQAVSRQELLLHFQPQIGSGERVVGAEALLRWHHPRRGMVPPGEFIPLAERCGLMAPIGDWVLRTACCQLALWSRDPLTRDLVLAVNVSASQFTQDDFVARVLAALESARAPASRLKLELTESMLAHDLDDVIAKMTQLKERGIQFSLDDFGTGFSSLTYLRRLPLDQLKIDQSFVHAMLDSANDAAIAKAVIELGRSLGLDVIAEGVETVAQWDALAELGCERYQGYLFSRPLPVDEFTAFVTRSASREAEKREAAETLF
jgi:EAL domain-containing protein (putative c-di-GMP-specific phosphodiesterase class I)